MVAPEAKKSSMISTSSSGGRNSALTSKFTSMPLVWLGAVSRKTGPAIVIGLTLRAYTTGTPIANPVITAGAIPEISTVRMRVTFTPLKRDANSCPMRIIISG